MPVMILAGIMMMMAVIVSLFLFVAWERIPATRWFAGAVALLFAGLIVAARMHMRAALADITEGRAQRKTGGFTARGRSRGPDRLLDITLTTCKSAPVTNLRLPSMSRTESLVLELLRVRDRYGLELVDDSSGTLKRGSVYVILARMEEKGFVESRQEARPAKAGGVPRRIYRATEYGLKVHDAFALLSDALALKPAEAR